MKTVRKTELPHLENFVAHTVKNFSDIAADQEMPAATKKRWCITIYTDYRALEKSWRQLETWGHCTVFQGYDCAASWYDAASSCGAAEPLIVVVSTDNGDITWILPLCISQHNNLKIVSFADLGVTDYAAPLMAPGAPADRESVRGMLEAIFGALPPCDIVSFQKLVTNIDNISNPLLLLRGLKNFPAKSHGIRITEAWPELAPKIMQRRLYKTIKQKRKKLEKQATITTTHYDTPETMAAVLERLMAMRRVRFQARGLPEMPPLWGEYYRNLVTRKDRKLYVSITTLNINDEPVAKCFGLTHDKNYYALLTTFKMGKWDSYRPGMQLFDIMLTQFAEQTGNDGYFDFTVGDEAFKTRFGSDSRVLYEWMAPRSLKGLPYYMAWQIKSYLRQHPRLFAVLQKILHKLRIVKKESKN